MLEPIRGRASTDTTSTSRFPTPGSLSTNRGLSPFIPRLPTSPMALDINTTAVRDADPVALPTQAGNRAAHNPPGGSWLEPAGVGPPTPVFVGPSAKGVIIGATLIAVSASVAKYLTIREGMKLRLEVLTNNVLNPPNSNNPAANISNTASAGVISAQSLDGIKQDDAGPRRIQLQLRLEF